MKKTTKRVIDILQRHQTARNCDKDLILMYLVNHSSLGLLDMPTIMVIYKALGEIPSFETITRVRRAIQAKGQYQSKEQIKKERAKFEKKMRKYFK